MSCRHPQTAACEAEIHWKRGLQLRSHLSMQEGQNCRYRPRVAPIPQKTDQGLASGVLAKTFPRLFCLQAAWGSSVSLVAEVVNLEAFPSPCAVVKALPENSLQALPQQRT